ncbi:efflux RND transporter periplasmic adaptor subunit [Schlesneria paludicola]|uniref:efflux RND transporter periplasmic adaptor subunit n=1 Tax=Schlesneria paludicola TaxID=360056 RepID=UPI00029A1506|nr:efflux RND transporter periplasmic adaptor subunit [Schlesneria paludicola]
MKALLAIVGVLTLCAVLFYSCCTQATQTVKYRTVSIERGDLTLTVGATGTVEPEEVVDVGAQLAGRIKEIGLDPRGKSDSSYANMTLDYGSPVEEGMLLVQIDPSVYVAQRDQAKANFDKAKADLLQMQAKREQTEAEWIRAQKLRGDTSGNPSTTGSQASAQFRAISDSDYISAKANHEIAKASVEVGKSVIDQSESALKLAEINLGYTTINSPVSGTIIDRRVNIGQTVVASLNTPSLFLIAKDLRRMQVWASVNEADIGLLSPNMPVQFTVDAFPKDRFYGRVSQIRLNASMTQNVVTYTVVIATDNSNMKLLPYLTADVKFQIEKRSDVLFVPNAALRYTPPQGRIAPENPELIPIPKGENQGVIWIQKDNFVSPLLVTLGINDGSSTEISGEGITEGVRVVLGEKSSSASDEVNNPFAPPKIPRNKQSDAAKKE